MSLSRTWIVIAIIIIRNEFGVSEKSTLSLHKGECVTTQDENPYSLLNYAVREWRHDDLPPACLPAARNNNNTANIGVARRSLFQPKSSKRYHLDKLNLF